MCRARVVVCVAIAATVLPAASSAHLDASSRYTHRACPATVENRVELRRRFEEAGHEARRVWWGNTRSFKQCDGDYAGSDGWVALIALHR